MKYLQDYINEKQSQAFKEAGAFFAFGKAQFDEQKVEGVRYTEIYGGLICPVDKANDLLEKLHTIHEEGIAEDIKENGIENIIKRELNNHEAYYTGDIESTVDALTMYPNATRENIARIFKNKNYKIND